MASREQGLLGILPDIILNQELGTDTGVDSVADFLEQVVEDMGSAEPNRWRTRVEVEPVVVGVGDGDLGVLCLVAVRVANERSLEVVGQLAVAHSDLGATVGNVEQTVVARYTGVNYSQWLEKTKHLQVLAVVEIARQVDMVNPNLRRLLDTEGVTSACLDLRDLEVADDDVRLLVDTETNTLQG